MKISLLVPGMLLASVPALAEGAAAIDIDSFSRPDIIISAAGVRNALQTLHSPSAGITVGLDQIGAVNMVNAEDVLRYAPGLIVRKRYIGDANATLSFRNMHTQQTPRALVLVDGFNISNFLGAGFTTAPKWAVLAPRDIERAEVIYGPASARYSGHSMGGAMNIATHPINRTGAWANGQIFGQNYRYYGTDENLFGWAIDSGFDVALGERGGISFGYRHFENSGQPQEWRTVSAASRYGDQAIVDSELPFLRIGAQDSVVDAREEQFRLRGHYTLGNWNVRGIAALLIDRDAMRNPESFLRDEAGQETFVGVSGINMSINKTSEFIAGIGISGEVDGWLLDLAVSRFDTLNGKTRTSDNFDMTTGVRPRTGRLGKSDAAWTNIEAVVERGWGAHAIAAGFSYAGYSDANQTFTTRDWQQADIVALRDASGGNTRLLGAFVQDEIRLTPMLGATLGLRYEHWQASNGYLTNNGATVSYGSRTDKAWSPKVALRLQPDDASQFTLSVALATRFPTVRELYQAGLIAYGPNVGELDLNGFNPDLKPERAVDLQWTAMRRFGDMRLTFGVYRQDVRNSIFTQSIAIPDAVTGELRQNSINTNIDKIRTWGADAIVTAENLLTRGLSLDANLGWIDTEITRNALNPALVGNAFPRVPAWRANASLRYSPTSRWMLAAGIRHQSTPHRNLENDATSRCGSFYCVSSFSFVDLKATLWAGSFELSAGVDNLLNEKAFVYHPYPGRTFLFSLAWDGRR